MQRWTTRRTFCNLRSRAKRWGSVRIGLKGSSFRDSLITSLSLNSGRARSWSRTSVELFILRKEKRGRQDKQDYWVLISWCLSKGTEKLVPLGQIALHSHAALRQWSQDGHLIMRVLPKPEHRMTWHTVKAHDKAESHNSVMFNCRFFSPSGIVQVENESFVPKLGKNLIVVSVHVACMRVNSYGIEVLLAVWTVE